MLKCPVCLMHLSFVFKCGKCGAEANRRSRIRCTTCVSLRMSAHMNYGPCNVCLFCEKEIENIIKPYEASFVKEHLENCTAYIAEIIKCGV